MLTPPALTIEDPGTTGFVTSGYCPQLSIQLMKEQMDTKFQDLLPPSQPPQYAPAHGTDDPYSPTFKSCLSGLK